MVEGVAPFSAATARDVTFFDRPGAVAPSQAGLVLVKAGVDAEPPPGQTWLQVAAPRAAFALVARRLVAERPDHDGANFTF